MGSENKDLSQSIIRAGGPTTDPDILENCDSGMGLFGNGTAKS